MKKVILVISIFLILLLTGCGIFDLDGWVWPDDPEFMAVVEELDTPEKIGNYMLENFTCEVHDLWALDPYELWKIKKGDCNDFSTFGVFIADYHGYETWQIRIYYDNTIFKHSIAVYDEDIWYGITDNRNYFFGFDSFREIVDWDSDNFTFLDWRKYIVYDYWDDIVETEYNN